MAKNIGWQMLVQASLLRLLYAAASLFLAVKFLPTDPLALGLSFMQVSAIKHMTLEAALLTGLLGAAVHFLLESDSFLLKWLYRAWTVLLLATGIFGLLGIYEGRYLLELPYVLDIFQLVLLALWLFLLAHGKGNLAKEIFLAALLIIGLSYGFSLLPIQSPLYDRILRVLMVNARYFVAYPLAALVLAYWLKPEIQIYQVAAALVLLGSMVSISPLTATGTIWATGLIIAPLIFLFSLFIVRMSFAKDNWGNLALLFFMLSLGILGAAFAFPALGMYMLGSQLSALQYELAAWAVLAIVFSLICQLSQDNAQGFRFWLTTGGLVTAFAALALAGVVQAFMERVLSIGYLDTQNTLLPLYIIWIIGILLWSLGIFLANLRLLRGNV